MQNISRKEQTRNELRIVKDDFTFWISQYLENDIREVRSKNVADKIELHLKRFRQFFLARYGHERIKVCIKRDIIAWQKYLSEEEKFAAATVNNYIASLSGFFSWLKIKEVISENPCKGVQELGLPPLEPRALTEAQIQSLKNVCDRLPRLYTLKGKRWAKKLDPGIHSYKRPWRDRAIVFVLLSTGLRREELVNLTLDQIVPNQIEKLRKAKMAKIKNVKGKAKTERVVYLSADARQALADYLEKERLMDAGENSTRLFLSAKGIPKRYPDGRMAPRTINFILERIGQIHDGEFPDRKLSPLQPHEFRHTFAFNLAEETEKDSYELERRLGHRSQRYIQRYTNPPEEVAASYVEKF